LGKGEKDRASRKDVRRGSKNKEETAELRTANTSSRSGIKTLNLALQRDKSHKGNREIVILGQSGGPPGKIFTVPSHIGAETLRKGGCTVPGNLISINPRRWNRRKKRI